MRIIKIAFLLVWLTACTTSAGSAIPGSVSPTVPAFISTGITPAPPIELTSGSLWVRILSPQDEAVVEIPEVEVSGQAAENTVITVNEEILIVGPNQQFKVTLSLEEGPNMIEIVASDFSGNEVSLILIVTYQP